MTHNPDPRTPVLVGIGVVEQRIDDVSRALEASELMIEAARRAATDAGNTALLVDADRISVPRGLWHYSNPAGLIARAVGATRATTVLAEIGILQQSLFADACRNIASGDCDIVVVAGGEAKYRQLQGSISGAEARETAQSDSPDITLTPENEIWSKIESDAGLGMPVGYYAILESAVRKAMGLGVEEHRDRLAKLYEDFSRIAVDNPHAWNRQGMDAPTIRNASGKNKMLAFPYTKYHNTQWNVDQASALIFCSVARARKLGIPEHKWVYPLSSTESNDMVNTACRRELHRSPGARLAGQRALELAGINVDELEFVELYSCFPAAVEIYAQELGIDMSRPLTVTGGMTFAGGPLNNYVLQATCRMAELLRSKPGSKGLVSSVSGMITKQGFGVWSTSANPRGFSFADVTRAVRKAAPPLELVPATDGEGRIAGYTVLFNGDDPARAIAVIDLPGDRRTVAYSEDGELMQRLMADEFVGAAIRTAADATFTLSL